MVPWLGWFKDLGAALRCDCKAGSWGEGDGEVDLIARNETAAVGKEEKKRDIRRMERGFGGGSDV